MTPALPRPAASVLLVLGGVSTPEALWTAHADGRHKLHGILDRIARPAGEAARPEEGGAA